MGRALAVLLWLITLFAVVLFSGRHGWFPEAISEHGPAIDAQFMRTLVVVAIAFIASQVALGWYVWHYRDTGKGAVVYTHGNTKVEVGMMLIVTVVFVSLAAMGQRVWAQLQLQDAPADSVQIEVTGQQFAWNIRYPEQTASSAGRIQSSSTIRKTRSVLTPRMQPRRMTSSV